MTANDFFYICLGFGFMVLVLCMAYMMIQVSEILSDFKKISGSISGITTDAEMLKDGIKVAILRVVERVLIKNKKGGDDKNSNDK